MKIFLLFVLIIASFSAFSCDVCNIFEYANRINKSYIGIYYRNRFFNGYQALGQRGQFDLLPTAVSDGSARLSHEPRFEDTYVNKTEKDYQQFQTVEFRANYAFKEKYNIQLIFPFLWNNIYYSESISFPDPQRVMKLNVSGIGDPMIIVDYVKATYSGLVKHVIRPGIGVKLPLGRNDLKSEKGTVYDYEIQPGTGSFDMLLKLAYMVTNDKWGIENFMSVRFNSKAPNGIWLGTKFNNMVSLYYTLKLKKVTVLPKFGIYFEWSEKDMLNNTYYDFTGGRSLFHQYGVDVMFKKCIVQCLYQSPLSEKLNGPVINNAGRLTIGLIYNID